MALWRGAHEFATRLVNNSIPSLTHVSERLLVPENVTGVLALGGVRGKKVKATGSTRNKCGHPKGKKRGPKVYDGQRIPAGSVLVTQLRPDILPGWNVRMGTFNNLLAMTHGRVLFTLEKCDLDYDVETASKYFPEHVRQEQIYKRHVHVIPDEQHQYFKLTEQV